MREIKFRAWNKTENKMMSWEELCDEDKNGSGDGEHLADYFNSVFSNVEPLMQFTGLKDKNGKEIYEGDIVRIPYQTDDINFIVRTVYYDYKNARFSTDDLIGDDSDDILARGIKVIGNIHENPELLKG